MLLTYLMRIIGECHNRAFTHIEYDTYTAERSLHMPAIIGNIKIVSVGSSAIVQFGDAIFLSPSSSSKTFAGAGSFLTGDVPQTYNGISLTNTNDPDVVDDSVSKVASP
jgi:hypothetical protein